jgi:hypothetical protein
MDSRLFDLGSPNEKNPPLVYEVHRPKITTKEVKLKTSVPDP